MDIRASLTGMRSHPPLNGYRNYEYQLEIQFENRSPNPAYRLNIINVYLPSGLQIQEPFHTQYAHVVSMLQPAKISATCSIILATDAFSETQSPAQRKKDFGDRIRIRFSYENQFGRTSTRLRTAAFEKNFTIAHSGKMGTFPLKKK